MSDKSMKIESSLYEMPLSYSANFNLEESPQIASLFHYLFVFRNEQRIECSDDLVSHEINGHKMLIITARIAFIDGTWQKTSYKNIIFLRVQDSSWQVEFTIYDAECFLDVVPKSDLTPVDSIMFFRTKIKEGKTYGEKFNVTQRVS